MAPPRLLSRAGWAYAAVLAAGPGALLSHGSAAWWWALTQRRGRRWQVSRGGTATRVRAGFVIHGRTDLGPEDRAVHERLALTSVERTLFDQAATTEYHDLANQFDPVLRITGLKLHLDPSWVLDTIGQALAAR